MNVCDWSDGDVVFANSTCFDDSLMRRMASAATALKKGTFFITLTKRLPVRAAGLWRYSLVARVSALHGLFLLLGCWLTISWKVRKSRIAMRV